MLPKTKRLNKKLFTELFLSGKTIKTDFFSIKKVKSDKPRISVVVSKKVAKKATTRNSLKRFIYALLKNQQFKESFIFFLKKPLDTKTEKQKAKEEIQKCIL